MSRCRRFAFVSFTLVLAALAGSSASAATVFASAYGAIGINFDNGLPPVIEDDMGVGYFQTTVDNRYVQRANFEFASLGIDPVGSALLQFDASFSDPANLVFELYVFDAPADLAVTVDDFDRAATVLASFDPTVDGVPLPDGTTLTFDVTAVVNAFAGNHFGFGVRLQGDVGYSDMLNRSGGIYTPTTAYDPPRLILQPVPEPGTTALLALGLFAFGAVRRRR